MAKKNYVSGHGDKDPHAADFLEANTNPWEATASGHGYNARWNDDDGYKRGEQSRGGSQAWESRSADEDSFLSPSQDHTDSGQPQSIYGDVMDHAGPAGDMLTGGGPVKQVGGGSGPPRYKPKTGPQSNGGL
jgi:hypothetical protein